MHHVEATEPMRHQLPWPMHALGQHPYSMHDAGCSMEGEMNSKELFLWIVLGLPRSVTILCIHSFVRAAQVAADEEPLALGTVVISPAAAQSLSAAWHKVRRKSLYSTEEDFIALCYQVS